MALVAPVCCRKPRDKTYNPPGPRCRYQGRVGLMFFLLSRSRVDVTQWGWGGGHLCLILAIQMGFIPRNWWVLPTVPFHARPWTCTPVGILSIVPVWPSISTITWFSSRLVNWHSILEPKIKRDYWKKRKKKIRIIMVTMYTLYLINQKCSKSEKAMIIREIGSSKIIIEFEFE